MKKYIVILFLAVAAVAAHAQFRYAPLVGVTITDLKFKQTNLVDVKQTVGATAGIQCEMMFPGIGFGIDFGLLYNHAGAKVNLGQRPIWAVDGYGNENIELHNIQIPVHLRFKWTRLEGLEDYIAPFVYGGPDFNIQAGHSKCDAMEFSGGDLGLTAGLGAEILTRWQLSASYTWGMTYVMKARLLDNWSARSGEWTVRLAYFF